MAKDLKKKKKADEEIVKKKKKKVVEEAPAKKKKKKVEEEVSSKKGKKAKAAKEEKSSKKSKKAEKPAKKAGKKPAKELPTYDPVKEKFKLTGLIEELADRADVDKKDVKRVIEALNEVILGSLVKKGVGEFMMPGLFKIKTVKKPAVKGGKTVKNPFKPGEMMVTKDKPATVKVKINSMKKLKDAALV